MINTNIEVATRTPRGILANVRSDSGDGKALLATIEELDEAITEGTNLFHMNIVLIKEKALQNTIKLVEKLYEASSTKNTVSLVIVDTAEALKDLVSIESNIPTNKIYITLYNYEIEEVLSNGIVSINGGFGDAWSFDCVKNLSIDEMNLYHKRYFLLDDDNQPPITTEQEVEAWLKTLNLPENPQEFLSFGASHKVGNLNTKNALMKLERLDAHKVIVRSYSGLLRFCANYYMKDWDEYSRLYNLKEITVLDYAKNRFLGDS